MPDRLVKTEGFILGREPAGETFDAYKLFSPRHGLLRCLGRQSSRASAKALPDLFDHASLQLEQSFRSQAWFIREYELKHRYQQIGRNYHAFSRASEFCKILAGNLAHASSAEELHSLLSQALEGWESGAKPDIVYLKVLYLLAYKEGYPVKQQWWPSLSPEDRQATTAILNTKLQEQNCKDHQVTALIESLKKWLLCHTDIAL